MVLLRLPLSAPSLTLSSVLFLLYLLCLPSFLCFHPPSPLLTGSGRHVALL